MLKRDLIKALEPYGDDQYVYVRLHVDDVRGASQIIIQGMEDNAPWHDGKSDRSNYLVGIVCHEQNRELENRSMYEKAQIVDDVGHQIVHALIALAKENGWLTYKDIDQRKEHSSFILRDQSTGEQWISGVMSNSKSEDRCGNVSNDDSGCSYPQLVCIECPLLERGSGKYDYVTVEQMIKMIKKGPCQKLMLNWHGEVVEIGPTGVVVVKGGAVEMGPSGDIVVREVQINPVEMRTLYRMSMAKQGEK